MVSISACHADDPGSIPGRGTFGAPIIRDCLVRRLYRRIDPPKLVFQARLAQSVERQALNLMVVGSSPTVGVFQIPKCRSAGFELARSKKEGLRRTHRPEVYLEPKWLR